MCRIEGTPHEAKSGDERGLVQPVPVKSGATAGQHTVESKVWAAAVGHPSSVDSMSSMPINIDQRSSDNCLAKNLIG